MDSLGVCEHYQREHMNNTPTQPPIPPDPQRLAKKILELAEDMLVATSVAKRPNVSGDPSRDPDVVLYYSKKEIEDFKLALLSLRAGCDLDRSEKLQLSKGRIFMEWFAKKCEKEIARIDAGTTPPQLEEYYTKVKTFLRSNADNFRNVASPMFDDLGKALKIPMAPSPGQEMTR